MNSGIDCAFDHDGPSGEVMFVAQCLLCLQLLVWIGSVRQKLWCQDYFHKNSFLVLCITILNNRLAKNFQDQDMEVVSLQKILPNFGSANFIQNSNIVKIF